MLFAAGLTEIITLPLMSVIVIERILAATFDFIYITSEAGLGYVEKLKAAISEIPFGKATKTVS